MADSPRSPGWYPDPDRSGGERWWNGVSWSDGRRGSDGATTASSTNISAQAPIERVIYSASNPAPQSPAEQHVHPPALVVIRAVNPAAVTAIAAAAVSVFINVLFIPSIVAIVFGIRAIVRANQLTAAGQPGGTKVLGVVAIAVAVATALVSVVFSLAVFVGGSG